MDLSYPLITGIYSNSSYWCSQWKAVCESQACFQLILLTPLFSRLSPSFLLGFASVVTRESLSRVYDQLVVADTAATSQNQHHEITDGEVADPDRYFHVIDAFKMPRVTYDQKRKVFEKWVVMTNIRTRRRSRSAMKREDSSNLPYPFISTLSLSPNQSSYTSDDSTSSFCKTCSSKREAESDSIHSVEKSQLLTSSRLGPGKRKRCFHEGSWILTKEW